MNLTKSPDVFVNGSACVKEVELQSLSEVFVDQANVMSAHYRL